VDDSNLLHIVFLNHPEIRTMLRPVSNLGRPPWEIGPGGERGQPPWEIGPGGERGQPPWEIGPGSERRQPRADVTAAHFDSGPVTGELELRPSRPLVGQSVEEWDGAERTSLERSRLVEQARRHQVTLGALGLILATLIWKGAFLSHFYFRQDDFWLMDAAAKNGLSGHYLLRVWSGQFIPGAYVLGWLQMKIAVYSWAVGAGVEIVLIAVASLMAWRALRTLLGNRPAILIPLALYLASPLTFQSYSWWISAVETVPLQIAIFGSLDAHIKYVRTHRLRHAVAAACWLAFGLLCFEKAAVIPLLLFAVTAGFLVRRRSLLAATRTAVAGFWRAWALYVGVLGIYLIVFFIELARWKTARPAVPNVHVAARFSWSLIYHSFLPGLLGGPWHWAISAGAAGGNAQPSHDVAWLALAVVAGIVVATLLTRRRAWRGWAILFGWLLVDDILPVVAGRVANFPSYAGLLGTQTRYVADISAVAAIAVAVIFWPVSAPAGDTAGNGGHIREFFDSATWRKAAVALVAVFAIGSAWTVAQYQQHTVVPVSSYITNARAALANVPAKTVILDRPVPNNVMINVYGHDDWTSTVLGPLAAPAAHIDWAARPAGNIGHLEMFGPDGRLYAAAIEGVTGTSRSVFGACLTGQKHQLVVPLPVRPSLAPWVRVLRIGYLANAGAAGSSVTVTYNGSTHEIPITGTVNNAYLPVTGTSPEVTLSANLGSGATFCFEKAVAGYFIPLPGTGVPASVSRSAS
jgi:hypothetical protein